MGYLTKATQLVSRSNENPLGSDHSVRQTKNAHLTGATIFYSFFFNFLPYLKLIFIFYKELGNKGNQDH